MRTMMRLAGGILSLLWLLASCQASQDLPLEGVPAVATVQTTVTLGDGQRAAASATPTPILQTVPEPILTAIPTARPAPAATAQPRMSITVATPEEWNDAVSTATATLNQMDPTRQWEVTVTADPAALLDQGQAEVAVIPDLQGDLPLERPLVLAVPFVTEWESMTSAQAQEILANGHALARLTHWDEIGPREKALRVDGLLPDQEGYPLANRAFLRSAAGFGAAAEALAAQMNEIAGMSRLVQLAFVGDIMLDRSLGNAISQGRLSYPFERVAQPLLQADLTIGNLESALGDIGEPAEKRYAFRAPPEAAEALALAGFDVMTLANNHAMDYGPEALLQGISLLRGQGVATIGAGANAAEAHAAVIQEVNGLRLAFLGYVHVPVEVSGFDTESWTATDSMPGLSWGTPEVIAADVRRVLPEVDAVVVLLHSGYEYVEAPSDPQIAAAHAAVDAGAKLVIGHHAHILQGIEYYGSGVIVYGLGNFAFQIEGDPATAVLNVWMDERGVRQLELLPAIVQFGGQPRFAEPWEAGVIRRHVYRLTRLLGFR